MKLRKFTALMLAVLMIFTMVGCGNSNTAEPADAAASTEPIKIATKPMTEQFILGSMLKEIIESNTDYTVEVTEGIAGGTSNIQPAMEAGDFDLYPEYTSSGWIMVLGHDASEVDDSTILEQLNTEYNEQFDMSWEGLYGFNNTYAVVVRKEVADKYNLKTTSDLAAVAGELTFGGNPDYQEREDGFPLLCSTYGLEFKDVKDIDIGVKYEALRNGDIDVTNGFTTDAQIGSGDVVVLEDDLHLQVNYFCSTVVRNDALENYPGLEEALKLMDGILSDDEMAGLNYKVEVEGMNEDEVAHEYLVEKGIVK